MGPGTRRNVRADGAVPRRAAHPQFSSAGSQPPSPPRPPHLRA